MSAPKFVGLESYRHAIGTCATRPYGHYTEPGACGDPRCEAEIKALKKAEFLRSIQYLWRGQLYYARQSKTESVMNAVARSVGRKIGPVTLWWSECRDGHDVYTAKWFDAKTETYEEAQVIV